MSDASLNAHPNKLKLKIKIKLVTGPHIVNAWMHTNFVMIYIVLRVLMCEKYILGVAVFPFNETNTSQMYVCRYNITCRRICACVHTILLQFDGSINDTKQNIMGEDSWSFHALPHFK